MPRRPAHLGRTGPSAAPRGSLETLAYQLKEIAKSNRPAHEHDIDPEIADWASTAIRRFLDDEEHSLDAAFELTRVGRPPRPVSPDEIEQGLRILLLKLEGDTWDAIADEIRYEGDISQLREHWRRVKPQVLSAFAQMLYPEQADN